MKLIDLLEKKYYLVLEGREVPLLASFCNPIARFNDFKDIDITQDNTIKPSEKYVVCGNKKQLYVYSLEQDETAKYKGILAYKDMGFGKYHVLGRDGKWKDLVI
ncbi:MAG: hypothetical protein ACTSR2_00080 [Candidatus Hodarchaeales archaeon]